MVVVVVDRVEGTGEREGIRERRSRKKTENGERTCQSRKPRDQSRERWEEDERDDEYSHPALPKRRKGDQESSTPQRSREGSLRL